MAELGGQEGGLRMLKSGGSLLGGSIFQAGFRTVEDTVFFTGLLRTTASVICRGSFLRISFCFYGQICFGEHNSQNFSIICLKEQRFYFATICVESLVCCIP